MKYAIIFAILSFSSASFPQVGTNGKNRKEEGRNVKEYHLVIEENEITLGGVIAKGMTINGSVALLNAVQSIHKTVGNHRKRDTAIIK